MDRIPDPYRELGILRGATDAQVKAAHRRLAKRFHPDASDGDHDRFLAIQEAYSLLSDPLRRRDWDAKHTSGPVRAGDPGPRRGGRGAGVPRPPREAGSAGKRGGDAGPPQGSSAGSSRARGAGAKGSGTQAGGAGDAERAGGAWSASDREPSSRSTTWSASGVPWWEDFSPRDRGAGSAGAGSAGPAGGTGGAHAPRGSGTSSAKGASRGTSGGATPTGAETAGAGAHGAGAPGAGAPAGSGTGGHRTTAHRSPEDVDVYSRSSGAAWSMAARRYFRKGEAELPKGGAWTYRGTQVVTGAEARKVNEEEAARKRAAETLLRSRAAGAAPPRTAFGHEGGRDASSGSTSRPRATSPAAATAPSRPAPTSARPAAAPPAAAAAAPDAAAPAPAAAAASVPAGQDASLLRRVRRALRLGG